MNENNEPKPSAPLSDDAIRACTIGDLKPLVGKVLIVDYDPKWPELFKREAERINAALGGRVITLEHVGSTSVPDLPAKPIIDILLVVADSAAEAEYVPDLERCNYVLRIREPEWHQHRMFKG